MLKYFLAMCFSFMFFVYSNAQKKGTKENVSSVKVGSTIKEPLFGKNHESVRVKNQQLKGACFYIVSGHGGPDPGAIGYVNKTEIHEDEYAYDVALRLAKALMEEGAKVHIIIQDSKDGIRDGAFLDNSKRETCMGKKIPLNQVDRLQQRCDAINLLYKKEKKKYQYCRSIFIHIDSRNKGMQTDVFFYYPEGKKNSRELALNMVNTFQSKYMKYQPGRGFSGTVGSRRLYVLRNCNTESVFVELGNIRNAFDRKRLMIDSNRQALANWLKSAFQKDYWEHKVTPKTKKK